MAAEDTSGFQMAEAAEQAGITGIRSPYLEVTIDFASAYVSKNALGYEHVPTLLRTVFSTIAELDGSPLAKNFSQAGQGQPAARATTVQAAEDVTHHAAQAAEPRKPRAAASAATQDSTASGQAPAPAKDEPPADKAPVPYDGLTALNSVTEHFISCMQCGKQLKSMKRHVKLHGQTPEQYRAYWRLPPDYPMVAPYYSKQRSELAKKIGLGGQGSGATGVPAKPKNDADDGADEGGEE